MSVTLVTCFFDIQREQRGDGRKISEYLEWIKKTLQLNTNLYIVTEEKFESFFRENMHEKSHLKIIKFTDLHYYKYYNNIKNIIETEDYKNRIKHPDRVECRLPEYNIIQYSKFHVLDMAMKENPFNSDYFFWIDAGISRFFLDVNIKKSYPGNNFMQILQNGRTFKNKFFIQSRSDLDYYPIDENFIWDSSNLLIGTMFGGSRVAIEKVAEKVEEQFLFMLDNNGVNNEQLALAMVWKKNPDLFCLVRNTTNHHLIIFKYLSE